MRHSSIAVVPIVRGLWTSWQRRRRGSSAYRLLLICDRPNWAYDAIARALIKHNHDPDLHLELFYLKGRVAQLERLRRRYDGFFALGWQTLGKLRDGCVEDQLSFLEPQRTITGIHSHHAWDERQTQPDRSVPPPACLVEFLGRYRGVNAVSERLTTIFREAGLTDVAATPNGVDIALFTPTAPIASDGALRVAFSGNKKHDWRKGISEFIEPACSLPGIELRLAMPQDGRHVPIEEMPALQRC